VEEIVLVSINECREWSFACFGTVLWGVDDKLAISAGEMA